MEAPNSNFYTCAELNVITDKGNSCDHSPVISCVETATISSGYQSLGVCRRTSPKIKSPYADYDDYKKDMPQCSGGSSKIFFTRPRPGQHKVGLTV